MNILFDIGGTHTRVAISIDGTKIDAVEKFETPQIFSDASSLLISKIENLILKYLEQKNSEKKITKITGCLPGITKDNVIINSPHLPKWNGHNLYDQLMKHFAQKIKIVNDADSACLGEAVYGAGKGYRNVAYMTVSTGVGGGYVSDGKISSGKFGIEPGRQIIDSESGRTLEEIAAGTAIKKHYGIELNKLDSELQEKVITESSKALAIGIKNMITSLSPDIFILGGSVILESEELFNTTKTELLKKISASQNSPVITRASLGDESGLYGALALAISR